MKKRLLAVLVAAAIGAILIAVLSGGATATPAQPETRVALSEVRETALRIAAIASEPSPHIEAAETTLGEAASLFTPGEGAPNVTDPRTGEPWADSPVIFVAMTGHFTGGGVPAPRGTAPPTGSLMELLIDSVSGSVVGEYIGNAATPNLRELNATVTDLG